MRYQYRCIILKVFTAILAAGLPLSGQTSEKSITKIAIGLSPFQDTLLPIIGKEKGWFADQGLDIDFKTLAWDAIIPAVASSAVDVAVCNTTGVVSVFNKQPEIIFWYPWNIFAQGAALMGRPNIGLKAATEFEKEGLSHAEAVKATIQQLKGKTVVTTMGTDMGKAVVEATRNNGLGRDDFKIVDMNPDEGLAAFISGTGEAYLGGIPQRTRLNKEGYLTLLTGSDLAPVPLNGWITTKGFAEKNPEALLKLQQVMFRIIRYTNANQDEVAKTITDRLNTETGAKMTIEDFKRFWNEIEAYPKNAAEVEKEILGDGGFANWKRTWDNDNYYFVDVEKLIPEKVPYDAFWGNKVQQVYIEKYGATESGY
jgi:NitT/TauT family transport system substrate-binding protein